MCVIFSRYTLMLLEIERKVMIRNRYNYLSPSVQDTKGKEDALKATAPQSLQLQQLNHYKQKAKRTVSFPKIVQTGIQNKKKNRASRWRATAYPRASAIAYPSASAIAYLRAHQNSKYIPPVLIHRAIVCESLRF